MDSPVFSSNPADHVAYGEWAEQRIKELEAENARLENRLAEGVHTCNDQCQRPMCVAVKRIKALETSLDMEAARSAEVLAQNTALHEAAQKVVDGTLTNPDINLDEAVYELAAVLE